MPEFIKNKHNRDIVNLDLVTSITPIILEVGSELILKTKHHIYFTFNAMNNEEEMCVTWKFKEKSDWLSVIDNILVTEL